MNLPNKLTVFRIFVTILIIFLLLFPFYNININFPKFVVDGKLIIDSKYIISGILFIIASITDFFDGYIARKKNLITDLGKILDAIADKILVNSLLIILSSVGFIPVIIPVIIIIRDIVVDTIKMIVGARAKVVAASYLGKIKTTFLMLGITFSLFYNLPFELLRINISEILLLIATVFAILSGIQYYIVNKDIIFPKEEIIEKI